MTPIKRNLLYIFRDTLLRLRISWSGRSLTLSVGYHVDRDKWDGTRCRPRTTHGRDSIQAATINQVLDNLEEKISQAFYRFEMADRIPGKEELKTLLTSTKEDRNDVWNAYDAFVIDGIQNSQWAPNTVKSVKQIKTLLKQALPKLTFDAISEETLEEFTRYQYSNKISTKTFSRGSEGYSNSVVEKNVRILRWFLRWAFRKGYIMHDIGRDYRPQIKSIEKPVVFLEWDELMRCEAADLSDNPIMDQARDIFLFCCFTSLRYSDAHALLKSAVKEDRFEVVTQKTSTPIVIDLNTHSRAILEKYKDSDSIYALPRLLNNGINRQLKRMGERLGINAPVSISQYYGSQRVDRVYPKYELLSIHCGRRTFICHALALGVPPAIVMKWTGHSDYSAMRPYIDIADTIRSQSMAVFDGAPAPYGKDAEPEKKTGTSGTKNGTKSARQGTTRADKMRHGTTIR